MASETMTVQEAIELCEPNDARASAEQWLTAMAVLVAHARATTAGTGAVPVVTVKDAHDAAMSACDEMNAARLAGDVQRAYQYGVQAIEFEHRALWRARDAHVSIATIETLQKSVLGILSDLAALQATGAGGGRVTEAMVEVACAAFSREWYEDVEARPMRVALTAALRAAGVGA